MITHIPKRYIGAGINPKVVFDSVSTGQTVIQALTPRYRRILENALINYEYVQIGDKRYMVKKSSELRAKNRTVVRFKLERVDKCL